MSDNLVPGLRQGVWISPGKKRIIFDFVGQPEFEENKKLAIQETPMHNAWVVQDLGVGMLTWSIEMVFCGESADADCEAMIDALRESGSGMLLHPGGKDILCLATGWKHQPTSLSSIRLAKLAVNFIKTIKQAYPGLQQDFEGDIALAKKDLLGPSPGLAQTINKFSQNDLVSIRRKIGDITNSILTPLKWVADTTTATSGLLFQAELQLKNLLTLDAPLMQTLQSVGNMCNIPTTANLDLQSKVSAYQEAFDRIVYANGSGTPLDDITWQIAQTLAIAGFTVFENSEPETADSATSFVATNVATYEYLLAHSTLPQDSLAQVLTMLNLSTHAMANKAMTLPKRQAMILSEDTSPLVAAYYMYNDVGMLDLFLQQNKLPAEHHLLIPRGAEVYRYG